MKLSLTRVVWVAALFTTASDCARANRMPKPPDVPTVASCQVYMNAALRELGRRSSATSSCMNSPARIGWGKNVRVRGYGASSSCEVYEQLRAWPHCFPQALAHCQATVESRVNYSRCMSKVQSQKAAQAAKAAAEKVMTTTEVAWDAYDLITDPSKFVADAAAKTRDQVLARMLDPEGKLIPDEVPRAQSMYDFAKKVADRGLDATEDPLIGAIQKASMNAITRHFDALWDDMKSVEKAVEGFSLANSPPPPSSKVMGEDLDCSILKDMQAQNELMMTDEQAWLGLVERCSRAR